MTSLRRQTRGLKDKRSDGTKVSNRRRGEWGFLIMWEFQVGAGMKKRFEKVYGTDGDWARFVRQDGSYVTTELVCASQAERIYMTLDFWTSQEDYESFRKQHLVKYEALDQKCEDLTVSEREIGRFARIFSE